MFLLADLAPEGGVLDVRLASAEVPLRLMSAQDRPAQRAVHLPPAQFARGGRDAAGCGVTFEEVLPAAEAADRSEGTEAPGLNAEPAEVFDRVAAMRQFPVSTPLTPDGVIIRFPLRKSPCTTARRPDGAGRWAASQRSATSIAGRGSLNDSCSAVMSVRGSPSGRPRTGAIVCRRARIPPRS